VAVVSAFLIPGSPLPYVQRDNPPWGALAAAMDQAGASLARSHPDTIVVYSTQWIAVLDQLWQTRPHVTGLHVDENWHEYGDLPYDITIDTALTEAIIAATPALDIRSKGVNYDAFPIDTGTIIAANFLNADARRPLAITSNNVYHDWDMTRGLGRVTAAQAAAIGRRIAVVGVGGLSGSIFRETIAIADDHIAGDGEDAWNRRILDLMAGGEVGKLIAACPEYAREARVDMGFKHFAFVLGALADRFDRATVHGYGPLYGSGGAVVEFHV
jgi:2-aminophenol/2-amino-5-chlorophenol 1,6-dioxygenase subunit alpha